MERQSSFSLDLRKDTSPKTGATSSTIAVTSLIPPGKMYHQIFETQLSRTPQEKQTSSCPLLTSRNAMVTEKTITQLQTQTKPDSHGKGHQIPLPGPMQEINQNLCLPKIVATTSMTATASVIPTGKTYHQMFEAQTQLSKSVLEARTTRHPVLISWNGMVSQQTITQMQTQVKPDSQGIGHWTQLPGLPQEINDVLCLPDIVVAQNSTSDICERITKKMESKHMQAMEELESLLAALSTKYAQLIQETGDRFLHEMSQYDGNMDRMMQRLDDISEMERFTYQFANLPLIQEIHDLWDTVNEELDKKKKLTAELGENLNQFVSKRTPMISEVLKKCKKSLEEIGYMMPSDIQKLLENKAMMINLEILASQRAVTNLIRNLKEKDLQKGLFLRFLWENKLQDWTYSKVQALVDGFKRFMSSSHIQQPEEVQATLESMRAEQRSLGERCRTILQGFSSSVPPECSRTVIMQWYSSLSSANEHIGKLHLDSLAKLHSCYERIWADCLDEVERFKEEVTALSLCQDRIQSIIDEEFMPLIGQRQHQSEEQLKAMNDHFERWVKRAAVVSKVLFKIAKDAACMWEAHSANLEKREEQLLQQLSKLDEDHQRKIKKKEASLDKLVEKMRQESSEKTLDVLMRNTLYPLAEMKLGYISFFHQKEKMVKRYPGIVLEEIYAYSMAVSRFFGVKEIFKLDTKELLKGFPLMSTDAEKPGGRTPVAGQRDADSQLFEDARDTFTTSQGNAYHITSRGPQWPEEEHGVSSPEMELVAYSGSLLDELHKELRLAFFNHLEGWFHTALTKALNTVETQNEELKAELDQRLSLRKLRAKSVKNDVHNVRVAELAQHHADINQHCDSVLLDLDQSVTHLENLKAEQSKQAVDFQAEVHKMESGFFSATSSKTLDDLFGTLHSRLDERQTLIKTSYRQFREDMQSKLDSLREANDDFSKSFKLFSEGGNFAPKEVEVFQKCLDEVAKQIDCTEEKLVSELEKSENRCLETAKNFVQKFENKHQFLVQGLKLLESLKRVPPKTQIQIKTEEGMSSMQSKKLDGMLEELQKIIDAYAAPILDEGAMKPEDIISFVALVAEELRKRGHYLDWPPDPPQKPSTKTTSFLTRRLVHQSRVLQGGKVLDMIQGLLRMSKENINKDNVTQDGMSKDTVIMDGVIKDNVNKDGVGQEGTSKDNAIKDGISKDGASQDGPSKDIMSQETRMEPADRGSTAGTAGVQSSFMVSASQQEWVQGSSKLSASESTRKTWEDTTDSERVKTKHTQLSRTFLDFGSKPGDEDITTFKGSMARIFRKANDLKLQLTKEFNRKMCQIPQQQILQDRFETCVEKVNQSLQVYYSQVLEYCCESQQEFWKQLQSFEERLAHLAELLVSHLGREHLKVLATESGRHRDQLRFALQNSKDNKEEHSRQLRMWLGYLDYERELEKLNAAEEERQQKLTSTINNFELEMQASMKQHGDEFVTELSSLTQNLLRQFDGLLTANEFHGRQPVETVTTLIRRKQAEGLDGNLHIGGRTWPGLCYLEYLECEGHMIPILEPHKSTASITAIKTTLGHCRAMEARDAAYQLYQRRYHEELVEIQEEIRTQRKQSQHWEQYWRDSLQTAKLLHTGEA